MSTMAAPALRIGDTLLGRYVLEARLGEGLGGETWKAAPVEGGTPVAIKVVVSSGPNGRSHRDLLNEAAFLRELDHPHIVPYLGVVDLPGVDATFLVTEYAAGGNLWEWTTARGPCSPLLAALLLGQVVEALEAVHARGILHRDLKPQNVLVRPMPSGIPSLLVADFGISRRIVENAASLTRHVGTIGYGAPEVWSKSTVSAAADIFSLGALGWFLLAGADPDPRPGRMQPDARDLPGRLPELTRVDASVLVALIANMLNAGPDTRPALRDVRHRLLAYVAANAPGLPTRRTLANGDASDAAISAPGAAPEARLAVPTREDPEPPADTPDDRPGTPPPALSAPRSTFVPWPEASEPADARRGRTGLWVALGIAVALGLLVCAGSLWNTPAPSLATSTAAPVEALPGATLTEHAPLTLRVAAPDAELPPAAPDAAIVSDAAPPRPRARAAAPPAPLAAATPASRVPAVPTGIVHRLRVGLDSPAGLPADATLSVRTSAGVESSAHSTQLMLTEVPAGLVTIEVRSSTRFLGHDVVAVPPGDDMKVLCRAMSADFAGLQCELRKPE